ncbi:unnamed protein product [Porites evermanni]|uniref:Uncharacterized protein n=1 Tax=Porites evermanni TaxID=104178 RepID=A0ABN8RKP0_9CNID|nr:unnamed protein product [Porites evermanni]
MAASLTAHILSNPIAFKDWPHYQSTGLYAAAQELDIPWTIIKGVSNYADGGLFEPNPWKKFASLMAASLTAHILSNPIAFKDWPHYQSTDETRSSVVHSSAVEDAYTV